MLPISSDHGDNDECDDDNDHVSAWARRPGSAFFAVEFGMFQ